jgi:hypothetical protein
MRYKIYFCAFRAEHLHYLFLRLYAARLFFRTSPPRVAGALRPYPGLPTLFPSGKLFFRC